MSSRKIQLKRIAHVYYKYPNLEKARQFLIDFGFVEEKRTTDISGKERIYFRGYGTEPWVFCAIKGDKPEFGGAAFVVESEADLLHAAETLPSAIGPDKLLDAPGGGHCVTFNDPVDGWPMYLVYGQKEAEKLDIPFTTAPVNYPMEKNRPANKTQRFIKRPAPVHKLGHFGVRTTNFAEAFKFYSTHFNFIASDILHDAEGIDTTAFFRLDRGKEQADHHSFFVAQGPSYKIHHTSYETYDFDTQLLGHDWLRDQGYENCWGVGRHVLGSQIFDYWFDPHKFIFEHYVDGDQVTSDEPTHRLRAGPELLYVWGPEVPKAFLLE
ncbi:glyoxalase [Nemania sp. FL0916]|nr:glyoxalase [Nemania sp. FL0916]